VDQKEHIESQEHMVEHIRHFLVDILAVHIRIDILGMAVDGTVDGYYYTNTADFGKDTADSGTDTADTGNSYQDSYPML
jgi:hypothetical protein